MWDLISFLQKYHQIYKDEQPCFLYLCGMLDKKKQLEKLSINLKPGENSLLRESKKRKFLLR